MTNTSTSISYQRTFNFNTDFLEKRDSAILDTLYSFLKQSYTEQEGVKIWEFRDENDQYQIRLSKQEVNIDFQSNIEEHSATEQEIEKLIATIKMVNTSD